MNRNFCFAFIFISLLTASASHADETLYTVVYVYDGDTVKLRPINSNNKKNDFKLRLTEIDAPERNQNYSLKSRRALIKLCQGNDILVTTEVIAKDKYHRSLGRLQCNHIDASLYLVEQGLAWNYTRYSIDAEIYQAEIDARVKRLGLWADDYPVSPWDWRRQHTH
ncbi:thermonuclease family protein [Methylotenera sp.]|uniref:thermonuclease family protein n=1 Tax=Methylotenera sp. TaxID=2051956 RepID=UPI002728658D|nr:thermonuclease family protein [Methylotenera sp.]MDO9394487.1 thermonuclease family protein [Methylotenera sp.]MDP2071030.1 thermonuclease family protein [Methylotenera sp.]MDP3005904.1 thermonuclease family protein [Methylotenera sp.]